MSQKRVRCGGCGRRVSPNRAYVNEDESIVRCGRCCEESVLAHAGVDSWDEFFGQMASAPQEGAEP